MKQEEGTIGRGKLSEGESFRLGPSREDLVVSGHLLDVTRVALSAGFGYHTAISFPVWKAYVRDPGPISGDTPDERLWTLLHALWVTHRNENPESDEVSYDFDGSAPLRSISMPTRVITVLKADDEIPFVTPTVTDSDTRSAVMPSVVRTAMERIISYLWDDEEKHWRESRGCCEQHIFSSIAAVRKWLDGNTQ